MERSNSDELILTAHDAAEDVELRNEAEANALEEAAVQNEEHEAKRARLDNGETAMGGGGLGDALEDFQVQQAIDATRRQAQEPPTGQATDTTTTREEDQGK